jgi:ATP-dependent RNA helicase RhlE
MLDPSEEWHFAKIQKLIRMSVPVVDLPEELEIVPSTRDESQKQLREIDRQRKIDDPTFKGAFHEKKQHYRDDKRNFTDKFERKKKPQKRRKRRG